MRTGHKIPTPEEIRCEWLDVSEQYTVAKTLNENAVEPNKRYAEKQEKAYRDSDRLLDLYKDLGYLVTKEEITL